MKKRAALMGFLFPCFIESSCPLPRGQVDGLLPTSAEHGVIDRTGTKPEAPMVPRSSAIFG